MGQVKPAPVRLGIIGGGPRALWAVEELAKAHAEVEIDVWEPEPHCGAGRVYRLDQPDYWLMNLRGSGISTAMGNFAECHPESGHFPPRAEVGGFLQASWEWLLGRLPETMKVRHVQERVQDVRLVSGRWQVTGDSGETGDSQETYDEVLVTAGHAQAWPGALSGPRVIDDLSQIPAGAHVGVRGTALTFIDVMLELTVGRGGAVQRGGDIPEYLPSGAEPVLHPVNRSGRFMEVKPVPGSALDGVQLPEEDYGRAILACQSVSELENVLVEAARDLLRTAGASVPAADLQAEIRGENRVEDPLADLRRSYDVAIGKQPPGAPWGIGEAWRRLYPWIVERASFSGRDDLPGFSRLSHTMERVAFGPPAETSGVILAVAQAGLLRVDGLGKPGRINDWLEPESAEVIGVVDATIAPPGVVPGTVVDQLVQQGYAQIRRGADGTGRGLAVEKDGAVPGTPGLSVIGRDTEDTVLGLDTLSRTLHHTIPDWAEHFIARHQQDHINT
ncbi:FAD/NAD(P)-binding protein [Corynebacterium suicordis]